jgi:chaperonin GroES
MSNASKKSTSIRPLSDRIVVKQKETESKSAGGIVIPDTADKDKPMQGTVLAIGNGKYVDGKITPLQVKVGDNVLFGKYAGTNIKLEGDEFLVMREEDVMGVIE